jgi:glycosyltransferase involved in cell wall biosynthesis
MKLPTVSVIIATFNSARALPPVLEAVKKQTYPQENIEILIIDGGSTDATPQIAKRFGCRYIRNPKVEPVFARYLGYRQAKGDFILFIDHDEVLLNRESIRQKIEVMQKNKQVKAVIGNGYLSPPGYHQVTRYINEFGDPFSFFMYRLSKNPDFFLSTMRKRYRVVRDIRAYTIFDLSSAAGAPIIELVAAGSMIDAKFYKKQFPEIMTQYYVMPHLLHLLRPEHPHLAIMKDDVVMHYSSDTWMGYMRKLIWRVKNNIFFSRTVGYSGFIGREKYESITFRVKKFLFIPYALSIALPLTDALYLIGTRRDISYIMHVPLAFVTALSILYFQIRKVLGMKPALTSYDGSHRAYEKT